MSISLTPFSTEVGTSLALPKPIPTLPEPSPHTTRAEKEKVPVLVMSNRKNGALGASLVMTKGPVDRWNKKSIENFLEEEQLTGGATLRSDPEQAIDAAVKAVVKANKELEREESEEEFEEPEHVLEEIFSTVFHFCWNIGSKYKMHRGWCQLKRQHAKQKKSRLAPRREGVKRTFDSMTIFEVFSHSK